MAITRPNSATTSANAAKDGKAGGASSKAGSVSASAQERKSGLLTLRAGEILFHEGDLAHSLYILQKGQVRLYKPKGKGFIELAVLRAGEVLGEMSYFAQDDSESKRSCSAETLVPSEVIEISFNAFGKTMNNLNPWFKTIINTLASRLRKTNAKVKELESNSVSIGYGGGTLGYQFFKSIDIVRLLSIFHLVGKSLGEAIDYGYRIHKNTIKFYCLDIFNLGESKFEEFANLLTSLDLMSVVLDKDNMPNIYMFKDISSLKTVMNFMHTQRTAADDKKLKVSSRCETFLDKIMGQVRENKNPQAKMEVDLKAILDEFKAQNIHINLEDLNQAKDAGFVSEVMVGENNKLSCTVDYERLKNTFLPLQVLNAVEKINLSKTRH